MDQRIIDLYDQYTHQPLSRQDFIKKLTLLTGSLTAALAVLPHIEVNGAKAAITDTDNLFIETISYAGVNGTMQGYLARPEKKGKYPAVVIIHENRGLNAHIEDVARRAAKAGFLALAPNILSPLGPLPQNDDELRAKFSTLKPDENLENFKRAFDFLDTRKDCNASYGCLGFCWGGAMANQLAVNLPRLKAAVPFYGRQPAAADVPRIKAALQLHYGGLDQRVNEGIPAYEAALKENKIEYEIFVYEGVNHAFHNDTAPARYNEAAARLAWERSMAFLHKKLGA
ncbi:MAG: dienelactone hydrolase family protein [Sphingobacteriia bacterium]|nr:MAG: dienelactone hydrolase family protein [Sphingobacteriia bacterium]